MNLIPGRWQREAGAGRFVADRLAIGVSAAAALQALPDGASVTCGIRPEHLRLLEVHTAPPDGERRIPTAAALVIGTGRIVMTELLGPSVLASVVMTTDRDAVRRQDGREEDGEGQPRELAVLVPAGEPAEEGREVAVGLDPSRAHFFDGRTGENMQGTRPGNERPAGRSRAGCEPQIEN
jgi:ABC-type sugar transport system ATPase subunit